MLAKPENIEKHLCVFCEQKIVNYFTAKTCGSVECKEGWKDYKALQRNKTLNCEHAKVNYDGGIRCSKGLFIRRYQEKGYSMPAIWYHPIKTCVECSFYADAGEYEKEKDYAILKELMEGVISD